MKEHSLSRIRKKPTSKLKLVCSFNGEFHIRPLSNKLRYIGGEARIVSVDRNISFSKLRLKISDICPNIRSFTLRYQLPLTGRSRKDNEADDEMPLVLIASDDDVKCMVDEYDKLELNGKHGRLWVFDPNPKFSTIQRDPYGEKIFLFNGMGNDRLHPLNPRDGNLRVETNGPMEPLVGRSSSGLCNGGGGKTGNTGQTSLPSKELDDCGVVSVRNGFDGKHFNSKGQVLTSNFNRENIMPWAVNCGSVKTHLPSNCNNQHVGSNYPGKSSYFGDRVSGIILLRQETIEVLDLIARWGHVILGSSRIQTSQSNSSLWELYDPSLLKLWPGFAEHALEGGASMMASCLNKGIFPFGIQYGKATFREQDAHAILQYGNSNTEESHLAYHDFWNGVVNQSFLSSDAVKIPSSCVRVMEASGRSIDWL
ncbi:hypothetical protein Patl1_13132 [Pistacia atlantica]|uniref:Uncharacterized protein n=1 Tax=Pistacia atlantica TaxID=434234 RepID=A0ACC1AUR2_9ROSI|nr:hypothetical protein Patl1_13132 [Pistacia atlantica]